MLKPALLMLVPALAFPILSYHTIAGDGSANAALTSSMTAPRVPDAPTLEMREEATYSVILERPLFSPSRRPVGPAAGPATAQTGPGGLTLLGVVAGAGRSIALVRAGEGTAATKAEAGQEIAGWQLTEIAPTEVVLERQGSRLELELPFKAAAPAPTVAPEATTPPEAETSPAAEAEPEPVLEPDEAELES